MFQLTKEEFDFLKSQFAMSNITDSQDNKNLKSQNAISNGVEQENFLMLSLAMELPCLVAC